MTINQSTIDNIIRIALIARIVVWSIPGLALDNVLKPILMGRGVDAPILVIFIGAIGGFISFGFLGLFFGAVVLVIAYDLLIAWLEEITAESANIAD